jgi:hypothetical protein
MRCSQSPPGSSGCHRPGGARFFGDSHVHAALIVSPAGHLAAVVERDDIANGQSSDTAAVLLGRLAGRTVAAEARRDSALTRMSAPVLRREDWQLTIRPGTWPYGW